MPFLKRYLRSMSSCRLRPVDVEFMRALQDKVNVVPLIAKADCLTPTEMKKLKERVNAALVFRSGIISEDKILSGRHFEHLYFKMRNDDLVMNCV